MRNTASDLIHIGRADFGVFQESASDLTRSLLPRSLAEQIAATSGVDDVAGIYLRVGEVQGRESTLVFGYDPDEFPARRLVIVDGRRPRGDEALVGDTGARTLGLAPGDMVDVERRRFRVAGLYHSGNRFVDGAVVLPLTTVQSLASRPGEVTTFGVTVTLGRRPDEVGKARRGAHPRRGRGHRAGCGRQGRHVEPPDHRRRLDLLGDGAHRRRHRRH